MKVYARMYGEMFAISFSEHCVRCGCVSQQDELAHSYFLYAHTRIHAYVHIRIPTLVLTYLLTLGTYVHTSLYVCMYVHAYVHMYIRMYTCICSTIRIWVHFFCAYIRM